MHNIHIRAAAVTAVLRYSRRLGRAEKAPRIARTNHSGRKHFVDTEQPAGLLLPSPKGPCDRIHASDVGRFLGKFEEVRPKSIAEVPPAAVW